jgi:competence protein ComEC
MDYQRSHSKNASLAFLVILAALLCGRHALAALPTDKLPAGHMRAHFIDVGQGSSVLLEFSCAAALIDTGGETNDQFDSTDALQTYLDNFFSHRPDLNKTLSLVLITHAHIDHTRGLPMVLSRYTVKNYVDNGSETGSGGRQQKAAHAKAKDKTSKLAWQAVTEPEVDTTDGLTSATISPITCAGDKIQFHAMWGDLQKSGGWTNAELNDQNDSSVVTQLMFGKTRFLFMGDLEEVVHGNMLGFFCDKAAPCPALLADVVHVAHHGSYNGTSTELVSALTPKIAVMSMGPSTRNAMWTAVAYGHPRQDAINQWLTDGKLLSRTAVDVQVATKAGSNTGTKSAGEFVPLSLNKALYGTGWDGTVVITADANGSVTPATEKGAP